MKKLLLTTMVSVGLLASSAMANPIANPASLQSVLDNITVGSGSSVNVATDEVPDDLDSYWSITATGTSAATLIIELASFSNVNTFGIYDIADPTKMVDVFGGAASAGAKTAISIALDGSISIAFVDTGIDFAGNLFGFYLISPEGTFYSDSSLNSDASDHMVAYQGTGDTVQLPNTPSGTWTSDEYILAFEDLLNDGTADNDFTDFVVMVESIEPVPEPATMALMGVGMVGMAAVRRRRKKMAL